MSFFKSRVFIFCLIAAILLTLIPTLIAAFGGTDLLRAALGTVAKPFTWCASGVANAFNGFINVFTEYDELKAENEQLREQLKEYENKEYEEELLREQNSWLKDHLNLHNAHPSFEFVDARVISRESGNYSTVITLDRGSAHGIKRNMPVLAADGLLGYVVELGLDWCKVSTVTETSSSIGVYTDRMGVLGVVEGSSELRHDGLCRMTYISNPNVQIGDRVYTSGGSDSLYPSGILVGTVSSVDIDPTTGEMVATVTPAVDLADIDSLRGAFILCGFEGSSGGAD